MFWNPRLRLLPGLATAMLLLCLSAHHLSAQPANDSCLNAQFLAIPSNFGQTLTVNGHNIGATPEIPASVNANCTPGGIFSGLGADVWYIFSVSEPMCVQVNLSGLQAPEFSLREGDDCNNTVEVACVSSPDGPLSEVVTLRANYTYYLRVSGANYSDQDYFSLSIQKVHCISDDPCMILDYFTASPEPYRALVDGEVVDFYLPGQCVEFCYTIDIWQNAGDNWLHSIDIEFGEAWDVWSAFPTLTPWACTDGYWDWYDFWYDCQTNQDFGPGFAFDSDAGLSCGGSSFDGIPGNNFGDGPQWCGPITFCWDVCVKSCSEIEANPDANDLSINITALGDAESGSWTNHVCGQSIDESLTLRTFECSDSPPSNPTFCYPQTPFIETSPVSCHGEMDGSFTVDNIETELPSNVYVYTLNDQLVEVFEDVELPFTIPGILDTGYYGVILETPGIGEEGFCEGTLYTIIKIEGPFETFARVETGGDCEADSLQLYARTWPADVDGFSYLWIGPNDYFSTLQNPIVTESGDYILTTIRDGCRVSDTITVNINVPLPLAVNYLDGPPCLGDELILQATGAGVGSANYTWILPNNQLPAPIYDPQNDSWNFGPIVNDMPLLLLGYAPSGCVDTIGFEVSISELPTLAYTASVSDCATPTVSVDINATDLASLQWLDDNSSDNPREFTDLLPGETLDVAVLLTNDQGCTTTSQVALVGPGANFMVDTTLLCNGESATLSASDAVAYLWSTGETSSSINVAPEPGTSATYTVSITDAYDCEIVESTTVTTLPEVSSAFSYTSDLLQYQFQPLAAEAEGVTYWWDLGDGTLSVNYAPQHTYSEPDTYEVTFISTGICGTDTVTQVVETLAAPQAAFSSNVTDGCAPLTVSFQNNSLYAESYEWSFPGGTPGSSIDFQPEVTYDAPGIYPVTLNAIGPGGTVTVTQESYIEVLPQASGSFTSTVGVLQADFQAEMENTTVFLWNFGDGTTNSTAQNPSHIYAEAGTYEVSLTLINTCGSVILTETITVLPNPPQVNFSADATVGCAPFNVSFLNNSIDAESYEWSFPGGTPNSSTAFQPEVVYNSPGVYPVTLTAIGLGGSNSATIESYIEVLPMPSGSFTTSSNMLLLNAAAEFENTDSFLWDFGDGNTNSTDQAPSHTYAEPGVYELSLSLTNSCGTVVISELVSILPAAPQASFSANLTDGCAPLTVEFTSQSINAESFAWSFPGGVPESSTGANPIVVYLSAGTYPVSLAVGNASGNDTSSINNFVIVDDSPGVSFTYTDDLLAVSFDALISNATSYSWDFGDGTGSDLEDPIHEYEIGGTYQVTLTAENDCGPTVVTQTVVVSRPIPTVAFTTDDQRNGCAPLEITFINQSLNALEYEWTFQGGTPATSTEVNPTVVYNSPGIYMVQLNAINESGGNALVAESYVEVFALPTGNFSYEANELVVDFTLTAENTNSIVWDFGDGSNSNEISPSHTYAGNGTYLVTVSLSNECDTLILSEEVSVMRALPVADFSTESTTSGCAPLTITFDNESVDADTYLWSFPGGTPASSEEVSPTVLYETAGTYPVSLIAINESGEDQLSVDGYVEVLGLPFATITYTIDGTSFDFTATSENADSYFWQFGDGSTSEEQNPQHTYSEPGVYTVQLSVSNECGTVAIAEEIEVVITSTQTIFGEDAHWQISPNPNDGNMKLMLKGWDTRGRHQLAIFNALGELIGQRTIEVAAPEQGFALRYDLPAGVYWIALSQQEGLREVRKVIIQ